ncbi:MAG: LysM peptidoglycan-binding domain-containing protein [Gemmatimonadales bacterium]
MKRWLLTTLLAGTTGCAQIGPGPQLAPEPETVVVEAPAPPAPEPEVAQAAPVPLAIRDTGRVRPPVASDSVRDEEMLERLHDVTASLPSDSASDEADLTALFDINVARYTQHERVRFYLDFFQGPARERMTVWLARMPVYEPMIRAALTARGLPSDLVYLALIESGFSNTAVSRSKAVGMWQFMRGTAGDYKLAVNSWIDQRRDPLRATHAAARYLADLTARFGGSHYLAAAAYNGGGGRVSRGLRKLGAGAEEDYFETEEVEEDLAADPTGDDRFFHLSDSRYLHKETKDYVPKLIAAAMIAKQPEKYGFPPIPAVEPYSVDSVPVTEPTSLEVVAKAGELPAETVEGLNRHFIRGMTPPGELHWVRVPTGTGVGITEALAAIPSSERVPAFGHVVGRRETVRSVAKRFGLSTKELVDFNPSITASSKLRAGMSLRIPGRVRSREVEPAPTGRAVAGRVHRVKKGESLAAIGRRYQLTVAQLLQWNDIDRDSKLSVGQRIRIGPQGTTTRQAAGKASVNAHLVRRGETLSSLARRYGVSVESLMSANGLRSARALRAGIRLRIPT